MSLIQLSLGQANPDTVSELCMRTLDRLQTNPPSDQLMSIAALFVLYCEQNKINPEDTLRYASNMMRDGNIHLKPTYRAIQEYLRHELS